MRLRRAHMPAHECSRSGADRSCAPSASIARISIDLDPHYSPSAPRANHRTQATRPEPFRGRFTFIYINRITYQYTVL